MSTWLIIVIIAVVVIGGGVGIYFWLKPPANTTTVAPGQKAPAPTHSNAGGLPLPSMGFLFQVGTRYFHVVAGGIQIDGYTPSAALSTATIPFPQYTDKTYVPGTQLDVYKHWIAVNAGHLGDGCGYSFGDLTNFYNDLIANDIINVPNTF